uniref:DUF6604 domain-containing protein n=1 Tax=Clonostachys solani TaxID=160281 RepID=A0A9N9YZV1_9HYPO|nr:unnamed protein product [Clonostachys solani]
MDNKNIRSIYRQYKNDTDSLASWLASTARHHGYPLDLSPRNQGNTSTPNSTGRLKGKARREARNAAPSAAKYIIPLHDFTQLANFIAKKRPPVVIPSSLVSTIDRLINLRVGFAKLLARHGQAFSSESEARHDYFVNILRGVRTILQPHPSPPGGAFLNRFSVLSVDEPSQGFLERFAKECDHAARPSQQADDPGVFEAGTQASEEELMFLCSSLLRDLNEIRSSIHPMWPQKETTWDPAAFSISTNVAVSLGRGLIDEVEPLLEKAKGGSMFMMETMASVMEKTAKDTAELTPPVATGSLSGAMQEAVQRIRDPYFSSFSNSIRSLKAQHEAMTIRDGFIISPRDADQIDLTRLPSVCSKEDWFDQDALRIEHYFCDMMLVLQTMGGFPVEDELFRAVKRYKNTSKVSMSLVFAFQIFLDISHLTEESFPSRFEQAKTEMENSLCDVEECSLVIKGLVHVSPDECRAALANLDGVRAHVKSFTDDKVFQEKKRISKVTDYDPPESVRHRIFRYSPLLCGLYLFFFRACFSTIALRDDPAPFIACAHIYHALQREQLLNCCWSDMDTAIALLGDNSFWMGGKRPETRFDYWKAILLQSGVSPSWFSKNTRPNTSRPSGSTSNRRPVYSKASTSLDFPMDTIRPYESLRSMTHAMPGAATDREEFVWTPAEVKTLLVGRSGAVRHGWREHRFLESNEDDSPSSRGLLASMLSFKLYNETMDLGFPFLRLHRQSRTLLKALHETFKPISPPGSELLMQKENLPSVIVAIFQLWNRPGPECNEALAKAAEVINKYLSAGEGRACVSASAEAGLPFEVTSAPEEREDA